MRIVPAGVLVAKESAFDSRRRELPPHYNQSLLDDPLAGQALKFYLLLTEMPDLLADEGFSAEERFWSRYYWFLLYVRLRQASAGPDAGLEQQALQILQHPQPPCSPGWSILTEVEAATERDASALRQARAGGSA
jgi:hypothetical protein